MKKVSILVGVIAAIFVFISSFFGVANDQYTDLINFPTTIAQENSTFGAQISFDVQKLRDDGRFKEFSDFLVDSQSAALQVTGETVNFFEQIMDGYLYLSSSFSSKTLGNAGCFSRFSKSSEKKWSTLSQNAEDETLIYLNPADYSPGKIQLSFSPLENIETSYGQFYFLSKKKESLNEFQTRFLDYIKSVSTFDASAFGVLPRYSGWNLAFFVIYGAAEFVLFYCFILNRQREIAIYRLNGCPNKQIFASVYSRYLKWMALTVLMTMLVLFLLILFPSAPIKLTFVLQGLLPFLLVHLIITLLIAGIGY